MICVIKLAEAGGIHFDVSRTRFFGKNHSIVVGSPKSTETVSQFRFHSLKQQWKTNKISQSSDGFPGRPGTEVQKRHAWSHIERKCSITFISFHPLRVKAGRFDSISFGCREQQHLQKKRFKAQNNVVSEQTLRLWKTWLTNVILTVSRDIGRFLGCSLTNSPRTLEQKLFVVCSSKCQNNSQSFNKKSCTDTIYSTRNAKSIADWGTSWSQFRKKLLRIF